MNHLISKGYDIHFCSMGSDRKYTSIFMGVLHHVQHIIYYFIMINNVCPFPYGILFYWWSVPFPVENINCYLHTWPDSVCPLIIKYIPTKSLSSCDINYLHTSTNTDAPQKWLSYVHNFSTKKTDSKGVIPVPSGTYIFLSHYQTKENSCLTV